MYVYQDDLQRTLNVRTVSQVLVYCAIVKGKINENCGLLTSTKSKWTVANVNRISIQYITNVGWFTTNHF